MVTDAPINIGFSVAFLMVIFRQYKRLGDGCWKKLAHDGMATIMLIVLSNTLCMIGNILSMLGHFTDMLYLFDW
jgi:hypothetical protein